MHFRGAFELTPFYSFALFFPYRDRALGSFHSSASNVAPYALQTRTKFLVGAWMLWSPYAFGTRMKLWSGHGCSGQDALGTRTKLWFGHGCSGDRMILEHQGNFGLGMEPPVTACSWNTNETMLWAWMLCTPDALGGGTKTCFGHGCSGYRMLLPST